MKRNKGKDESAEWRSATWEGATSEAMRRWATLPLERIIAAQEEMAELAEELGKGRHPPVKKEE